MDFLICSYRYAEPQGRISEVPRFIDKQQIMNENLGICKTPQHSEDLITIAHEFKNTLDTLYGFYQLLQREIENGATEKELQEIYTTIEICFKQGFSISESLKKYSQHQKQ